jgi:hypothetical protein
MKAIDLSTTSPTLRDVLDLAAEDNVILRTPEGRQFVLAEIDDFADEVARVTSNDGLMQLLAERSKEPARFTLNQVREQLRGKEKGRGSKNAKHQGKPPSGAPEHREFRRGHFSFYSPRSSG